MLEFSKLTLSDIEKLRKYFTTFPNPNRTCDNTLGGTFMWRDFFDTEYTVEDNTLIFKTKYIDGNIAFPRPLGENIGTALQKIKDYCGRFDIPIEFCTADEKDIELYGKYFDILSISPEPDWNDYLYLASDLSTMQGRRYNGQRNHINFFKKNYPDWIFEKINGDNIGQVKRFFSRYQQKNKGISDIYEYERKSVCEVLENYSAFGMLGGILKINAEEIAAFAVGEIIDDTLYVHIEKAAEIRGAYQMTVKEFASLFANERIKYINREEDVGDEGLRRSKLSYHPCQIIEKYTVFCK